MTTPMGGYCGVYYQCDGFHRTESVEECPTGNRYEDGFGTYRPDASHCVRDPTCKKRASLNYEAPPKHVTRECFR